MGLLLGTGSAYPIQNSIFIIHNEAVVLPDVLGKALQLAAIQMEQPPAAFAHHMGMQVAIVVIAGILVAGGSPLRGGKAAHLPGGRQPLQVAVNGGLADLLLLQNGTKGLRGDRAGQRLQRF